MGKPVGSWFGQLPIKVKIRAGKFCSRIVLTIYTGCYRKTASKAWNLYQRWALINGTQISARNIPCGKTGLPFQMFQSAPRNFALQLPEKTWSIYFSTGYEDSQETGSKFVFQNSPTVQFDTTHQRGEVWRPVTMVAKFLDRNNRELKQRRWRRQREREKTMGRLFKRSLT